MPTVVEARTIPVRYESWQEWRATVREAAARRAEPVARVPTEFCALCWGAGRVLGAAPNGEGLVPVPCGWCGGAGRLPVAPPGP
ncbi:hypothetical protein [Miltoncostaea marina]|uniref:hypothetical protein n=1 Tax=Miltoncostaea marina TaxID=2843215 RepID=UPI001C3E7B62|nr:hypothetical protein [Miltoncostaea marina]